MDISILRKRIERLSRERKVMEDKQLHIRHGMVECSFIKRQVQCSRPNCRCQEGKKNWHGPYYYTSRKVDGKTVYQYVPKSQWYEVDEQARTYRIYQQRLAQIRGINRAIDGLFNQIRDALVRLGKRKR